MYFLCTQNIPNLKGNKGFCFRFDHISLIAACTTLKYMNKCNAVFFRVYFNTCVSKTLKKRNASLICFTIVLFIYDRAMIFGNNVYCFGCFISIAHLWNGTFQTWSWLYCCSLDGPLAPVPPFRPTSCILGYKTWEKTLPTVVHKAAVTQS